MKVSLNGVLFVLAFIVFTVTGFIATHTYVFGASWDSESIQVEADRWYASIENWRDMAEAWSSGREAKQEAMYGYDFLRELHDVKEQHCNEKGCWVYSGLFDIHFIPKENTELIAMITQSDDAIEVECELKGCKTYNSKTLQRSSLTPYSARKISELPFNYDAEYYYENGDTWSTSGLLFTSGTLYWESSNGGQVIYFTNTQGDRWESSNFGQVLVFEGADGTRWESSNFGQSIEHFDPQTGEEVGESGSNARNLRSTESATQDPWR